MTELPAGQRNAIGVTLGLLGDEWSLLILREALLGASRFVDWRARLPISNAVLTARLSRLTDAGLFVRGNGYRLTERGADVWSILLSIWAWEDRWVPGHVERLPGRVHRLCDKPFDPVLVCSACDAAVVASDRSLAGGFGPSGSWERSVPEATTRRRSGGGEVGSLNAGLFPETTALIGNRWSAALVGAAFQGVHRFSDFQRCLNSSPTMVADRIRTLCSLGVLSDDYRLTAKGLAFFPVVMCLVGWAQRWYRAAEGPALVYRHVPCGADFVAALDCSTCGDRLARKDVVPTS
ncbi:winged helix-turn-helix transcriptional regulator [Kutzneria kofuensis]|uniref:DNA-binding HxlR family transcriptional regulator n=1 Tax=Kutzneria kofuensis TaxID=103725 RepID=A0A7W9KMM9_9PSEU|nr:helix-turn-helix domain-containing protein [Kutzneria kofuensis]MBB5895346.1 DNA-binding HxlR family transcriptional regulator [Kutzneria kofuensis]